MQRSVFSRESGWSGRLSWSRLRALQDPRRAGHPAAWDQARDLPQVRASSGKEVLSIPSELKGQRAGGNGPAAQVATRMPQGHAKTIFMKG